jgi:hypothetical protein
MHRNLSLESDYTNFLIILSSSNQANATMSPLIVIPLSNIHLPASQFAWNTILVPSTVVVAPPGEVISKGLLVTANGAELLVNGPVIDFAVA